MAWDAWGVGGTAPIVVPPPGLTLPARRSLERVLVAMVTALVVAMFVGVLVSVVRNADDGRRAIALSAIPEGVTAHLVDGHPIIAVRTASAVTLYDGWSPRGELVRYCATTLRHGTARFETPLAASVWDLDGRKLSGPDPRGLDRYETTIGDGQVSFDPAHPQLGAALYGNGRAASGTPLTATVTASAWVDPFTDGGGCD